MKRTSYLGPSGAPRGRPSSHARAPPVPVPKAPLPFSLPSMRREAGGDGAGGGIAGAGAKWASPRAADAAARADAPERDPLRRDDARPSKDPAESPAAATPRAWGGVGMRAVRSTPDFPELGNRSPAPLPPFHPPPAANAAKSMTPLSASQAVDRRRSKPSDDVRVLSKGSPSHSPEMAASPVATSPVAISPADATEDPKNAASDSTTAGAPKQSASAISITTASTTAKPVAAEDDDWAQDGDDMDFSNPVKLPEVTIPDLPPPPATQQAPSISPPPAHQGPRAGFMNERARPRQVHAPPAAHWAHAIRLQQEDERRTNDPRSHSPVHRPQRASLEGQSNPHPGGQESAVDLTVIKDQKSIMRSKAEVAQEARRKAEEERLRLQKERSAAKLRELERRLGVKKNGDSASNPSAAPANHLTQPVNVASKEDHRRLSSGAQDDTQSAQNPSTPRVVLKRPKADPSQGSGDRRPRDTRISERTNEHNPRDGPNLTMRRSRNMRHAGIEHELGTTSESDRLRRGSFRGRDYDGPAEGETREQWLDRRRKKTETRDAVRSVIELCINRAVYGSKHPPKRPQSRRHAAQGVNVSSKRDHPRRETSAVSSEKSSTKLTAGRDSTAQAAAGPASVAKPVAPSTETSNTTSSKIVLAHSREGSERKVPPAPLRPAPWAKHVENQRNAQMYTASVNVPKGTDVSQNELQTPSDAISHGMQSAKGMMDPTPIEAVLAEKAPPSKSVARHAPQTSTASSKSGPESRSNPLGKPTSSTSVRQEVDSVTIVPPLGGNVRVLMNPHARRDSWDAAGSTSHQNGSSVVRSHVDNSRPHEKMHDMSGRRRGGKAPLVGPERRDGVRKSSERAVTASGSDSRTAKSPKDHFSSKLPTQTTPRDVGEESAAWERPPPPASFDAITRAFLNQPAAFPLVGAPLIPPVPVVPVLPAAGQGATPSNFEGKHDAWGATEGWSTPGGNTEIPNSLWSSGNQPGAQPPVSVQTPAHPSVQLSGQATEQSSAQPSTATTLADGGPRGSKKPFQRKPENEKVAAGKPRPNAGDTSETLSTTAQAGKVEGSGKGKRRPSRGSKKIKKFDKQKESAAVSGQYPDKKDTTTGKNPVNVSPERNTAQARTSSSSKRGQASHKTKGEASNAQLQADQVVEENVRGASGAQESGKGPSQPQESGSNDDSGLEGLRSAKQEPDPASSTAASQNTSGTNGRASRKRFGSRGKKKVDRDSKLKHFITTESTVVEVDPVQSTKARSHKTVASENKKDHGRPVNANANANANATANANAESNLKPPRSDGSGTNARIQQPQAAPDTDPSAGDVVKTQPESSPTNIQQPITSDQPKAESAEREADHGAKSSSGQENHSAKDADTTGSRGNHSAKDADTTTGSRGRERRGRGWRGGRRGGRGRGGGGGRGGRGRFNSGTNSDSQNAQGSDSNVARPAVAKAVTSTGQS